MNAKLHIDLSQGLVDVEGSEELVRAVYEDVKDRIHAPGQRTRSHGTEDSAQSSGHAEAKTGDAGDKPASARPTKQGRNKGPESHSIVGALDLSSNGGKPSLRDFLKAYDVKSNYERNVLFVYYLINHAKLEKVNDNDIFTCYRNVGAKLPKFFNQGLFDTANKRGYINTKSLDDIKLTNAGINAVEHDIGKVTPKAA